MRSQSSCSDIVVGEPNSQTLVNPHGDQVPLKLQPGRTPLNCYQPSLTIGPKTSTGTTERGSAHDCDEDDDHLQSQSLSQRIVLKVIDNNSQDRAQGSNHHGSKAGGEAHRVSLPSNEENLVIMYSSSFVDSQPHRAFKAVPDTNASQSHNENSAKSTLERRQNVHPHHSDSEPPFAHDSLFCSEVGVAEETVSGLIDEVSQQNNTQGPETRTAPLQSTAQAAARPHTEPPKQAPKPTPQITSTLPAQRPTPQGYVPSSVNSAWGGQDTINSLVGTPPMDAQIEQAQRQQTDAQESTEKDRAGESEDENPHYETDEREFNTGRSVLSHAFRAPYTMSVRTNKETPGQKRKRFADVGDDGEEDVRCIPSAQIVIEEKTIYTIRIVDKEDHIVDTSRRLLSQRSEAVAINSANLWQKRKLVDNLINQSFDDARHTLSTLSKNTMSGPHSSNVSREVMDLIPAKRRRAELVPQQEDMCVQTSQQPMETEGASVQDELETAATEAAQSCGTPQRKDTPPSPRNRRVLMYLPDDGVYYPATFASKADGDRFYTNEDGDQPYAVKYYCKGEWQNHSADGTELVRNEWAQKGNEVLVRNIHATIRATVRKACKSRDSYILALIDGSEVEMPWRDVSITTQAATLETNILNNGPGLTPNRRMSPRRHSTSRNTGQLYSSGKKGGPIFEGWVFCLTLGSGRYGGRLDPEKMRDIPVNAVDQEREAMGQELADAIKKHGGKVLETDEDLARAIYSQHQVAVVSDEYRRTRKFLLALSARVPVVGSEWIFRSVKLQKLLDPSHYLLHRGWSLSQNCKIVNKEMSKLPPPAMCPPTTQIAGAINRNGLALGTPMKICLDGTREFIDFWHLIIRHCRLPLQLSRGMREAQVVIVDSTEWDGRKALSQKGNMAVLQRAARLGVHVVTCYWLIECLVRDIVVPIEDPFVIPDG